MRRLNQNERGLSIPKGLEEVEIPLLMGLRSCLRSYGPAASASWWIAIHFKRPVPRWSTLDASARAFFDSVRQAPTERRAARAVDGNVQLEAIPRSGTGGDTFDLALTNDGDSGGWVLEELERNLNLIIAEKTKKIAIVRARYRVWWLLLVDQIAFGLSEYDRAQFEASIQIRHQWDEVVLVNPLDHTHYFEM